VTDESLGEVPFHAHAELLQLFLAHRKEIVPEPLTADRAHHAESAGPTPPRLSGA
jgi:hypothetical protein